MWGREEAQVHAPAFTKRDQKGILGGANLGQCPAGLDRAFTENGGFGSAARVRVVMLQGKQEREIRIAPERGGVGALRDRTIRGDKPVVGPVELLARGLKLVLILALNLRAQAAPDGIAETDQAANALGARGGQGMVIPN